jgi:septal ring factor EnvC (AmiA/AmiB activator)
VTFAHAKTRRQAVTKKIAMTGLAALMLVAVFPAAAQDVPGIELCTRESRLDRRVSCLQSNVEFLQQIIAKSTRESQQKLNAATRDLGMLKELLAVEGASMAEVREEIAGLKSRLDQLQREGQPGAPPNRKASNGSEP